MKLVDYVIISKPDHIEFICPYCNEDVVVPFGEVDFKNRLLG